MFCITFLRIFFAAGKKTWSFKPKTREAWQKKYPVMKQSQQKIHGKKNWCSAHNMNGKIVGQTEWIWSEQIKKLQQVNDDAWNVNQSLRQTIENQFLHRAQVMRRKNVGPVEPEGAACKGGKRGNQSSGMPCVLGSSGTIDILMVGRVSYV